MQIQQGLDEARGMTERGGTQTAEPDWRGQYVGLLLELEHCNSIESSRISPALLFSVVSGTQKMHDVTRKLKIERLISNLEDAHADEIDTRWEQGSQAFETGFQILCAAQMATFQSKAAKSAQHLMLVEELFRRHSGMRTDTKKLLRIKQHQRNLVDSAIKGWHAWQVASQPDSPATAITAEVSKAAYTGTYPWSHAEHEGFSLHQTSALQILQTAIKSHTTAYNPYSLGYYVICMHLEHEYGSAITHCEV